MPSINDKIKYLHDRYIHQLKIEKRWIRCLQLFLLLIFFTCWEVASSRAWIDPLIFSAPSKVWSLFIEKIADGSLFLDVGVTLTETILGFVLGTAAGVFLAAILWWSRILAKIFDPFLVVLNAMPKVALGPVFIVAIGPNMTSIIAMSAIVCVIITTIVIHTAFQEMDPNYLKVLKSFGATRFQCFKQAILPSSFPVIISTLKVNVGLSWVGAIFGEFLVSSKGLGYMIIYGFQVFNFTLVFLSLFIIAIFATMMYQLVELLERKTVSSRIF
ncbi:ABC transporter permease [Bacillaceae bacterium Marseille-Q3522]|nr:ABC transporter permease [Bacillaceae bacterium Marseille-Q3522]